MDFDAELLERAKTFVPDRSREDTRLQVITCGLGRSGTTSLSVALNQLGFGPVHHFQSLPFDATLSKAWVRAIRALDRGENVPKEQWDLIFRGFNSTVGTPACHVADVLAKMYPEAKVIINQRDFESWFKSWAGLGGSKPRVSWIWQILVPSLRARVEVWREQQKATGLLGAFSTSDPKAEMRGIYDSHYARMRENIPLDRRLDWNLADGWKPLCAFLNVPVPDQPFPHVHSSAEFKEKRKRVDPVIRQLAWDNIKWALKTGTATVAIMTAIMWLLRSRASSRRSLGFC
ncbi:hypothetical protein BST61_g5334 [Cercospora zeina]